MESSEIVELLREEIAGYGVLLGLFEEQQGHLFSRNVDKVLQTAALIDLRVAEASHCREAREQWLGAFACSKGEHSGSSLRKLLVFFPPEERPMLEACIDEIKIDAREYRLRERNRAPRFLSAVQAAERLQRLIVERLHADGDAVDARRAVIAKAPLFDAVGIGFERDFGILRDRPKRRDAIEHRAHRAAAHQRWRSAAEEDAADPGTCIPLHGLDRVQLAQDRVLPTRLAEALPHMGVKIAVWAFGRAKGPVDVNAEISGHRSVDG